MKKIKLDEYSKIGPAISWVLLVIWVTASYILSYFGKDTNSTVTVALVSNSIFQQGIYSAYQAKLKTDRNKHGLDEDGVPLADINASGSDAHD